MKYFKKKRETTNSENVPDNSSASATNHQPTKDDTCESSEYEKMTKSNNAEGLFSNQIKPDAQSNLSFVLYLSKKISDQKKKYDLSLFINAENKELWSEDAQPINESNGERNFFLIAAFDGMGGAGAQRYKLHDQSERTGAAIGAALAREVTLEFFRDTLLNDNRDDDFRKDYHLDLEKILKERFTQKIDKLHENPDNKPRIFGTLTRFLPTTAAVQFVKINKDRNYTISSIWAGDSINFIFTPELGIQQITNDDFAVPCDALERIRQGPILSNMVQACINKRDFNLRRFDFDIQANQKFILISCSDGAFDYFPNPAEFELNLLKYMLVVDNPEAWKQNLTELFKNIAQDDVTIALRAFGFSSYSEIKSAFEQRYDYLKKMIEEIKSNAQKEMEKQSSKVFAENEQVNNDVKDKEKKANKEELAKESSVKQTEKPVADYVSEYNEDIIIEMEKPIEEKQASEDDAEENETAKSDEKMTAELESSKPTLAVDVNKQIWDYYKLVYESFTIEIKRHLQLNK